MTPERAPGGATVAALRPAGEARALRAARTRPVVRVLGTAAFLEETEAQAFELSAEEAGRLGVDDA